MNGANAKSATYVVVGSGPAGCACAASLLRCDGDPATTVIVLERGPRLGRDATSSGAFPRALFAAPPGGRAPYVAAAAPPFAGCAWSGTVAAVGGGSALNAGGLFHDAAYWGGGWGGGAAWAPATMRRCARAALAALGGPGPPPPSAAARAFLEAAARAGFAVAPGAPVDREAWEASAAGRGAAFAPRVAFATGGARLDASRLLAGDRRATVAAGRAAVRVAFDGAGRAAGVVLADGATVAAERAVVVAGGGEATAALLAASGVPARGGGVRDHPAVAVPVVSAAPRRRAAAALAACAALLAAARRPRAAAGLAAAAAAARLAPGPPRAAPAYAGVAFGDGFQLSYVAAGLAGPGCALAARAAGDRRRAAPGPRPALRAAEAALGAAAAAARAAWPRGAEPFDVGAVVATVSRPDAAGGAPLSPRDAAALARGLDAAEDVADGLRAELRNAARWSPADRALEALIGALLRGLGLAPPPRADGAARAAFLATRAASLWHPAGGAARGAALDAETLEVRGAPRLYVAGAAAMPELPSVNPMLTCYAMGWRLGELLAARHDSSTRPSMAKSMAARRANVVRYH